MSEGAKRINPAVIAKAAHLAQKLYLIAANTAESEYTRKTDMVQVLIPLLERAVQPQSAAVTISEGAAKRLTIELVLPEGVDYMTTADIPSLAAMHAMQFLVTPSEAIEDTEVGGES